MTTPPSGSYDGLIGRAGSPGAYTTDALVPEPLATSIIQELPKACNALNLCKRTVMSTRTQRMPVLDVLPIAYWVGGDTGLKQTTKQHWKGVNLVVEELATIVPIPQAYLDDADVPIWSEVQPRMLEAAGYLIDAAVFWGVDRPSTWSTDLYTQAVAANNIVTDGTAVDFGGDIALLGEHMALTGYTVNGFAGRPGLNWRMIGMRSAQGIPIFAANTIKDQGPADGGSLYGYNISMVENGSWDASKAQIIAGDFNKAIIGVRQDIGFKMFTEGVVSDDAGKVVLNLMQQDAVAMRMVMRLAFATANPITMQNKGKADSARYPFGVLKNA